MHDLLGVNIVNAFQKIDNNDLGFFQIGKSKLLDIAIKRKRI